MRVQSIDIVAGRAGAFYLLPTIGLTSYGLIGGRTAYMLIFMLLGFHFGVVVRVYNIRN